MTDFFEKMTEDYAQKHFPDGSVFASALKTVKRRHRRLHLLWLVFGRFAVWAGVGDWQDA
jgi:hypothetical protein